MCKCIYVKLYCKDGRNEERVACTRKEEISMNLKETYNLGTTVADIRIILK